MAKLAVAHRWGLLADEAYHWTWSLAPAWGYYDQPPLVAWADALAGAAFGPSALALRAIPVVAWVAAVAALAPWARDRGLWLVWALGLPPLALLTNLAVPDALLLAAWGGAVAAALRGGRAWLLAGLLGGLASLAKHDGALVLPLLLAGADAAERRTRWPWLALGIAVLLLLPNLAWNAGHGWVTVRFQLREGLFHPDAPGVWGPIRFAGDQLLFATPVAAAAVIAWMWGRPASRADRMCLATSAPVLVGFALAAMGGPPDAHWPAPAWIGAGLGLARARGRLARVAGVGAWLSALATLAMGVHADRPLVRLGADPATRLSEGHVLGQAVAQWALPSAAEPDAPPLAVLTERYQEAALIHWTTGIQAFVLPGCGRPSQYDLEVREIPATALFVRPARSGPPRCLEADYGPSPSPRRIEGRDAAGRRVGPWDLFVVGE